MNGESLFALLVSLPGSLLLASVFLAAALPKLRNPRGFAMTVVGYQILPLALSRLYARIVPPVELLASLLLLGGIAVRPAAAILALLLVSFSVAVAVNLVRGRELDCGCFGNKAPSSPASSRRTSRRINPGALLRDLALLAVALIVCAAQPGLALASWSPVRLADSSPAVVSLAVLICVAATLGTALALGRAKPAMKPAGSSPIMPSRERWVSAPQLNGSRSLVESHQDRLGR